MRTDQPWFQVDPSEIHQGFIWEHRMVFVWCVRTLQGRQNDRVTMSGSQKTGEAIEGDIECHVAGIKQMICF